MLSEENKQPLKLDVGCGKEKHDGYVGVDIVGVPGVDVVCDINEGLPYNNESVQEILTSHLLEHIENLEKVMKEFHRVLRPGGILKIFVPHCFSPIAFGDPTHKRFFTFDTFTQFDPDHPKAYYRDFHFEFLSALMQPYHRWHRNNLISSFLVWLVNSDQRIGERFLKVFPFYDWEIYIELRKT